MVDTLSGRCRQSYLSFLAPLSFSQRTGRTKLSVRSAGGLSLSLYPSCIYPASDFLRGVRQVPVHERYIIQYTCHMDTVALFRLNRALEEANKLRGELGAAEREKKEAKVTQLSPDLSPNFKTFEEPRKSIPRNQFRQPA